MGLGIGNGLVNLFKYWGKGIGNAADHVWLRANAQKAIRDEITKKFQPRIELARKAESKSAENIKDLDAKLTQSKEDLANAQKAWQEKYDNALAGAKNQRQTDIDNYNAQSKKYQDALDNASARRQSIFDKLADGEDNYDPSRTMFTDVNTGKNYIYNPFSGGYRSLDSLSKKEREKFIENYGNFDNRLIDFSNNPSGRIVNAFDENNISKYQGNSIFDRYYRNKISTHNTDIKDADNQINQADDVLRNWQKNNSQPQAWDDNADLGLFETNFQSSNGAKPNKYSFNGQNYSKSGLDKAYKDALASEQKMQSLYSRRASRYASKQEAEIAKRIQDAKDMNKAKAFLGAGALYAGAKAIYGSDDTDNTGNIDNINNTDNTDNTDYGKPDPAFKAENTPEGKAGLNGKSIIDTDFDPDKADAVATLAAAAHDEGAEDSNSIESSDDHFIDDDELYGLLKAMEDPHKADAVANYIYSKHGDKSDVQRLGWRGWLNKYYGDLLRSRMGLDPSSYNGMHISGGL